MATGRTVVHDARHLEGIGIEMVLEREVGMSLMSPRGRHRERCRAGGMTGSAEIPLGRTTREMTEIEAGRRGRRGRTGGQMRREEAGISIGKPVKLVKAELEVAGKGMPMPSDECPAALGGRGNTGMHLVSVVGETTRNHEEVQVDLRSGIVVILAEGRIAHRPLEAREEGVRSTGLGHGRAPILDVEGGTARRPETTDPVHPSHRECFRCSSLVCVSC
jgi:hypothetical protein